MCTYLAKRGSIYIFRRVIPAELRSFLGGKVEFSLSLRTKDREAAKRLIPHHTIETDKVLDGARRALADTSSDAAATGAPVPTGAVLTDAEREAQEFAAAEAEAAAERWRLRRPARDRARHRMQYGSERLGSTELAARDLIREAQSKQRLREHELEEIKKSLPQEVAAPLAALVRSTDAMLDTTIIDLWSSERGVTLRTKDAHRAVARWFYDRTARRPVHEITRAHVLAFKDALLDEGQTPANINTKLSRLRTLLSWAESNDYAESNAALRVHVIDGAAARNRRKSFDLAALTAIFSGPVHAQGVRPTPGRCEAAYWLPLLALYSGARLEELGQLRVTDLQQLSYPGADDAECTSWFLNITEDDDEGLQLKNAESERLVPLHHDIEGLGFVAYVEKVRAAGHARVFPDLRPGAYDRLTPKWGEWFSRYRRETCGITDRRMVFHSFRHTFKDQCRHVGIIEGVQRQLMGHSSGDVADGYGSGHSHYQLVEAMRTYRVAGLKLPPPPSGI